MRNCLPRDSPPAAIGTGRIVASESTDRVTLENSAVKNLRSEEPLGYFRSYNAADKRFSCAFVAVITTDMKSISHGGERSD